MDKLIDLLFKTMKNKGHKLEVVILENDGHVPIIANEVENKDQLKETLRNYIDTNAEWYER